MAVQLWIVGLSALLVHVVVGRTHAFLDGSDYSDCDVDVWPQLSDPDVINKNVPSSCVSGTFRWDYPQRTVHLHFPNDSRRKMSVCITNDMLGNIFTVRDITHGLGFPMVIGEEQSCTTKYTTAIVLRIDAPTQLYYMASIRYHVYTV